MTADFDRAVIAVIRAIPPGSVSTYGVIAAQAGYPRHARHVGVLLRRAPAELALPWYRVIGSDGRIARPGTEQADYQCVLLAHDGVVPDEKGRINLRCYGWPQQEFMRKA